MARKKPSGRSTFLPVAFMLGVGGAILACVLVSLPLSRCDVCHGVGRLDWADLFDDAPETGSPDQVIAVCERCDRMGRVSLFLLWGGDPPERYHLRFVERHGGIAMPEASAERILRERAR